MDQVNPCAVAQIIIHKGAKDFVVPSWGSSQTRGPIGAVTAILHHSHSNARSEPSLQPIPQLTATPDP